MDHGCRRRRGHSGSAVRRLARVAPSPGGAGGVISVGRLASHPIAGALFDLDNTLWDRDDAFRRWATAFVEAQLPHAGAEERAAAVDRLVVLDAHGHGSKPAMFAAFKTAHPGVGAPVERLVERFYREMACYAVLDPAVPSLLDTLHRSGTPFGIVTNGSRRQLRTVHALGLDGLAACVLVSGILGCRKPDAPIFAAAALRLRVAPGEILFAGDNPVADICGAHRAGMRTAWLRRGRTWPPDLPDGCADLIVDDIAALARLLRTTT